MRINPINMCQQSRSIIVLPDAVHVGLLDFALLLRSCHQKAIFTLLVANAQELSQNLSVVTAGSGMTRCLFLQKVTDVRLLK